VGATQTSISPFFHPYSHLSANPTQKCSREKPSFILRSEQPAPAQHSIETSKDTLPS